MRLLRAAITTMMAMHAIAAVSSPALAQGERNRTDGAVIAVFEGARSDASRALLDGFRQRLGGLGRRVDIRIVSGTERPAGPDPDLVVALGSQAAAAASRAYTGVPMIGTLVARESTLPSGTNVTGVLLEFSAATEFEYMRRLLPSARRIGVVFSTEENARNLSRLRDVARNYNVELIARRVTSPAELPTALAALAGNVDAIWGVQDEVVVTPETARSILLFSLRNRVPFIGLSAQWVRAGAVYALDRDFTDLGVQTADMAARLLDGSSPRSVAPVRPRKAVYALNARSAQLMRVSFTPELVRGAQEVIR
jgi:putative tryptophan/tyrosine transport system substrate-binding protein